MSEFAKDLMIDEDVVEEKEPWSVTDDRSAEWAVSKIKEARRDTEFWKTYYDAQKSSVKKSNENTEAFFLSKLQEYFSGVPHKKTSTQEKYVLPSADLILKNGGTDYDIEDEDALVAWLEANGMEDLVKTKKEVRWADLKKLVSAGGEFVYLKETGEKLPGIKASETEQKFTLTIKGDK